MEKHLTRRTTLDELSELWGARTFSGKAAENWAIFCAVVEATLVGGGELWEWESDELRSFAGTYGVAVVVDGMWVRE